LHHRWNSWGTGTCKAQAAGLSLLEGASLHMTAVQISTVTAISFLNATLSGVVPSRCCLLKNNQQDITKSGFVIKMLFQYQGETEFPTAGILKYVEDLKRRPNPEIGPKDNFETTSKH
jgi:hypothetical protein